LEDIRLDNKYKIELVTPIKIQEETTDLKKAVASVIDFPEDKQMDLLYFTAIYVTTNTNLNNAHFMPSEVFAAKGTISSKALDIEHKESEIIGHLYSYSFINKDGSKIENQEMASMEKAELDSKEFHVVVAGVIYKARFPEIAREVSEGNWKVSMECYYGGYDVKIGDLILSVPEAEALGLTSASKEDVLGKEAKVMKAGKEVAAGKVARVLRNICFSGCGIVKSPANPPSIILETASKDEDIIVLNQIDNNVSSVKEDDKKEKSELVYNDSVGMCISFKKTVIDNTKKTGADNVIHENWCALYDKNCTSSSRDTTDSKCRKTVEAMQTAKACVKELMKAKVVKDNRNNLVKKLTASITKAKKIL
jgi:hypothetical protein